MKRLKPGERATRSGHYVVVGRDGRITGRSAVVTKGEPMPPTSRAGSVYRLSAPIREGRAKAATMDAIDKTTDRFKSAMKSLAKR